MPELNEPRRSHTLLRSLLAPPRPFRVQSRTLAISGVIAGLVACGGPLVRGIVTDWSAPRLLSYALLALLFLVVTTVHNLFVDEPFWPKSFEWVYLLGMGGVGLLLQTLSGDGFVQPAVFTILLVSAAMCFSAAATALIGTIYLALIALGLWLSGQSITIALLPTASYGALMAFMYVFTRLAVDQAAARHQADVLAADLARERDYLAHLVAVTATLTRELDLAVVLEHVAAAGRTLAHAEQAALWLHEAESQTALQLAASVPATASRLVSPSDHTTFALATEPIVSPTILRLPLLFKAAPIGVLELRAQPDQPFGAADVQLLQPFVDAATIAIVNARLYEQARLSATLAERNRLGRELHDTIAQGLTAVSMQLAAAQRSFERDPARASARLDRAATLTHETLEQVRRSVWMLAEPVIEGEALSVALDELTTRFAQRTGLEARYNHEGPPPALGHTAATQALRIVQEALHNIEKHADARQVRVCSQHDATTLRITIEDDGCGFDPAALPQLNATAQPNGSGFGLLSLRERARLAGGTLMIESAPGAGTSIMVTLSAER